MKKREDLIPTPDVGDSSRFDARVEKLLDEMRHSSPPRTRSSPLDEAECTRRMEKHPSALERFTEIVGRAEGKKIVLFLDYNGTLAEIGEDINQALMTPSMTEAVDAVATTFPTAIVSGSCLNKLGRFIKHEKLYYAGSHGMDIRGPGLSANSASYVAPTAERFVPMIQEMYNHLKETAGKIEGCMLEDKKFCLSVHYRRVKDEAEYPNLARDVCLELERFEDMCPKHGRKVVEIRPNIRWDKGNAIEHLLTIPEFSSPAGVFPIHIGDDVTDEDAFKVLKDKNLGVGILVSKVSKATSAFYSLRNIEEVMDFLLRLVKWKCHQ